MKISTRKTSISILLFVSYAIFLLWGAFQLPNGKGPDEHANIATIEFYQKYKRLAHLPDDVDKTKLSPYGSTRLTRPPFPFIASSLSDAIWHNDDKPYFGSRIATALTLALCVVVFFHITQVLNISLLSGLTATILCASIPQFLFHGTYINDDAGAFLSCALLTLVFVKIIQSDLLTPQLLIAAATACGFVLSNKLTAWMILPPFAITVIFHLIAQKTYLRLPKIPFWIVAIAAFIVAGGFWIVYNALTYGVEDVFQRKIENQIMGQYGKIDAPGQRGYGPRFNIFYFDLLRDYEFLRASFHAFIGRLGLLEIVLNDITYLWFGIVISFSILSFFAYIYNHSFARKEARDVIFIPLVVFSLLWVLIQFAMYLYFNVEVDVQIQGKYVLPALPIMVVFLGFGLDMLKERLNISQILWQPTLMAITWTFVSLSLFTKVIPFYNPPPYRIFMHTPIEINFDDERLFEVIANMDYRQNDDYAALLATSTDPLIIFTAEMCEKVGSNFVLNLEFTANQSDLLRVYIDEGEGFRNKYSYRLRYDKGSNNAHIAVAVDECKYIRIDPMEHIETKITKMRVNLTPFHAQKTSKY